MTSIELTDEQYDALSDAYANQAPSLSGKPGFLTSLREDLLVDELLEPEFARIVKAQSMLREVPPSQIIQQAIKQALVA
jgi:hypothetical protein